MGTPAKAYEGLNESNRLMWIDNEAGAIADDATWTITLPESGIAQLPVIRAVITYGAGAVGARTATYYPIVDTGSALVGVEVVSFVETTGVLTLQNRSGGALSDIRTVFDIIGDVE